MEAEKVADDLYGHYDRRWLDEWNKQPPQLWRWLQFLDVIDSEITIRVSDNKVLGFMGLAQLSYSNKSQENLKSPYKWMAKG
jgi:hypothetical protein